MKNLSRRQLFVRRFFLKAEARVETLPPFAATIASAAFIGTFALYGMILSGDARRVTNDVTAALGFEVNTVSITGHNQIPEREILDILGLEPGVSLLSFDVAAAHRILLREPMIRSASVRKVYPGKLLIGVKERVPFAVWQRGSIVSVIDENGHVLDHFDRERHSTLPVLVGHGAQNQGQDFIAELEAYPAIRSRVRASLFRAQRRWDLLLDNNITVKLPEKDVSTALAHLVTLDEESDILSKDVESIDLRLPDRLVMRLSDKAVVNRLATLKQRRNGRNAEKKI